MSSYQKRFTENLVLCRSNIMVSQNSENNDATRRFDENQNDLN